MLIFLRNEIEQARDVKYVSYTAVLLKQHTRTSVLFFSWGEKGACTHHNGVARHPHMTNYSLAAFFPSQGTCQAVSGFGDLEGLADCLAEFSMARKREGCWRDSSHCKK